MIIKTVINYMSTTTVLGMTHQKHFKLLFVVFRFWLLGFELVWGAAWRCPLEFGSSRPRPPGLVQGYPGLFSLFCFLSVCLVLCCFWVSFVGVREVLNSVLSIERTGAYSGVSGFNV